MSFGAVTIGDHVMVLATRAMMPNDGLGDTYVITFSDTVTGERYEKSFTGEADAWNAFAAWLAADEPEKVLAAEKALRADPAMSKFLP
jgi:hypothetical protein